MQADTNSILRSYAHGINDEYNGRSHRVAFPHTLAEAQRLQARNNGKNEGKMLWNMIAQRVLSPQWNPIVSSMKAAACGNNPRVTLYIITVPPAEVLSGTSVKFWTIALTYEDVYGSYHMMSSDHPSGIHIRATYIACTVEFEVAPPGKTTFSGESVFLEHDGDPNPTYLLVEWSTGDSVQDRFENISRVLLNK
jgi:hypothetical protein